MANSASKYVPADTLPAIGWREWVTLTALGTREQNTPDVSTALRREPIKAKVDTGARSSSLHAFDVEEFEEGGFNMVRFQVHPRQRAEVPTIECIAPVFEFREIRSSSGHSERRPVILAEVELMKARWTVELTLANRDQMGFRMLLGREAMRDRFLVHPGASYLAGRRKRSKRPKS